MEAVEALQKVKADHYKDYSSPPRQTSSSAQSSARSQQPTGPPYQEQEPGSGAASANVPVLAANQTAD